MVQNCTGHWQKYAATIRYTPLAAGTRQNRKGVKVQGLLPMSRTMLHLSLLPFPSSRDFFEVTDIKKKGHEDYRSVLTGPLNVLDTVEIRKKIIY